MPKVKEIMTTQVITVTKDTPILEALKLLAKNNITGIPVVDYDMTLAGIVTEKDVLRLFYTYEEHKNETVSSFMTQPAVHFDENEALGDVCECLMNYFLRRVPVTSNGKVVGIISRPDIIEYILQQRRRKTIPAGVAPE